jgi:hypothetical protein
MKTSIVYGNPDGGGLRRAFLPEEKLAADGLLRTRPTAYDPPIFVPAHDEIPDTMHVGSHGYQVVKGQTIPWKPPSNAAAKVIAQEYADALDLLDDLIEDYVQRRRDILLRAWNEGRPLEVKDLQK